MSDRIVKSYVKEVAKPQGLILTGSGGAMMDDIKRVTLNFLSYDSMTIAEARALYVEMMEEFLGRMNENEKIRPYLHTYPFQTANYRLMIGFEDKSKKITHDGHVALMFIGRNNELLFDAYDAEKGKFYSLHREPYEESLRIVKASKGRVAHSH